MTIQFVYMGLMAQITKYVVHFRLRNLISRHLDFLKTQRIFNIIEVTNCVWYSD